MSNLILARLAAPFGMWETHSTLPQDETPSPLCRLHAVWRANAKDGTHPIVTAFLPDLLQVLPSGHLALVDLRRGVERARYVWAGTALVRLFGSALAGRLLSECYSGQVLLEVYDAYRRMQAENGPVFSHRRFRVFEEKLGYHRLLLPLADESGRPGYAMLMIIPKAGLKEAADWRPLEVEVELINLFRQHGSPGVAVPHDATHV